GLPFGGAGGWGHVLGGGRQTRHQVVPCPECGRGVFVLPRSPWPPPGRGSSRRRTAGPEGAGAPDAVAARGLRLWRWPLLAAGITLAVVMVGFAVLFNLLPQRPTPTGDTVAAGLRTR